MYMYSFLFFSLFKKRFRLNITSSDFIQRRREKKKKTYNHPLVKSSYVTRFKTYEFDSLFSISYDHVICLSLYVQEAREED
jgi:hypothetical protein